MAKTYIKMKIFKYIYISKLLNTVTNKYLFLCYLVASLEGGCKMMKSYELNHQKKYC